MKLKLPDGAYDEDLNKVKHVSSALNKGMLVYVIYKGGRYEFRKSKRRNGGIIFTDVSQVGISGGKAVRLSLTSSNNDDLGLLNALSFETDDKIERYVNFFKDEISKKGDYNKTILDGVSYNTETVLFSANLHFSFLGDYKPLNSKPKKWNRNLLIRGLLNYQLQQVKYYDYDADSNYISDDEKKPISDNIGLVKEIVKYDSIKRVIWSDTSKKRLSLMLIGGLGYVLEVIDKALR